jgi:serine-type D-Ala-D-Ala carboxypeptidase/endopeptidase (penicillin-binding protein 4)
MRSRLLLLGVVGLLLGLGLGMLSPHLPSSLPWLTTAATAEEVVNAAAVLPGDALEPAAPVAGTAEPTPELTVEPTVEPTVEAPVAPEAVVASPAATPAFLARLAEVLADPDLPTDGRLAVSILDRQGRLVLDHHAGEALIPASTQKLLTAAAALVALGPDHRYTTRVVATAVPGPDGVLTGDLILVGGGDPALASPTFMEQVLPDRPHTPLAALADQLVAGGLTRVTGDVLGDPTVFADEPIPSGWLDSYLADLDGTPVSGLTIDGGRRMFMRNGRLQGVPAPDPAAEAAAALLTLLQQRGVVIDGGATSTRVPAPAAALLGEIAGPALHDLLRYTVQHSDNGLADGIFRSIGAAAGDPTWHGAAAAVYRALEPLRLEWTGAALADGSGLSRDDRLSAGLLAGLDARMTSSSLGQEWQDLMAVAGSSGTLRRRLVGTVAEGRLRGKTGSLRDVRSLSGLVVGPDGTGYHFAIIANGLGDAEKAAARALQDTLPLALAEDLFGCERIPVPLPADSPPDAPPAYEVRCAAA